MSKQANGPYQKVPNPIIHHFKNLLLGHKPTHSYKFRTLYLVCLRWLVVEISRTEGWARKIQIHDRNVTRAIFIENSNNGNRRKVDDFIYLFFEGSSDKDFPTNEV
jgi:hypothetical protein